MNTKLDGPNISRRGFLAFAGAASSLALLASRQLFAQDDGLVQMARRSAASANITVQKLRGNIGVCKVNGDVAIGMSGPVILQGDTRSIELQSPLLIEDVCGNCSSRRGGKVKFQPSTRVVVESRFFVFV